MEKVKITGIIILSVISALAVFHALHYVLFCRYRGSAERSHCSVCRHRRRCRKSAAFNDAADRDENKKSM